MVFQNYALYPHMTVEQNMSFGLRLKRYPKAVVRDFDGNPRSVTEMDALVAYLQMLGTLVDFKLYDAKANLR